VCLQIALRGLTGRDSYQILLGAVAFSVIRAGTTSGLLTLLLCAGAKVVFFLPAVRPDPHPEAAVRLALFLIIGGVMCWIGGRLHASERRLAAALDKVHVLSGLLPICAGCKKIKDAGGDWCDLETYFRAHSDTEFSHGLCQACAERLYPEYSGANTKLTR